MVPIKTGIFGDLSADCVVPTGNFFISVSWKCVPVESWKLYSCTYLFMYKVYLVLKIFSSGCLCESGEQVSVDRFSY